jgi:hypothetical protein
LAQFFSSALQNQNNFQFSEICGYIKKFDNKFFSPLSFVVVFGSRIRDKHPGSATLIVHKKSFFLGLVLFPDPDPQPDPNPKSDPDPPLMIL